MSQAGARSGRGDEYQLRVATKWLIALLTDPEVVAVQVESLGMPEDSEPPLVDDVVVEFADGRRVYAQAKKNHPQNRTWSLRDGVLRDELVKARDQLEREGESSLSIVRFYARSPFGMLQTLAEGVCDYPNLKAFGSAPQNVRDELRALATLWERDQEATFSLARRLTFTVTPDYEEMDCEHLAFLRMLFVEPKNVLGVMEECLRSQQARLRHPRIVLRRQDLEEVLAARGHVRSPYRSIADQLALFERSSRIGRGWERSIVGVHIPRREKEGILEAIREGARSILVTGEPGIGKTCVMLDVADAIEEDQALALLFIKGDRFGGAVSDADLVARGLPDDIVGRCAHLASERRVVVLLDALDVLSLQRANGTLELFLGLLDRLSVLENVCTVAACRTFDVAYDPLLRGRSWDTRVAVGHLSAERDVAPMLEGWGIVPSSLDPGLIQVLRVPARLRLYRQLIGGGKRIERVGSVYELHERYLQSVEDSLGEEARGALVHTAEFMQEMRTLEIPRSAAPGTATLLRGLLSSGVLIETERGYAFGHQELLDVVVVRAVLARGQSLQAFVASGPALPFIRPTVRVFMQVLRAGGSALFQRQVRTFLSDEHIAYHLKRLVAETLAELVPDEEDVQLVRWLMETHWDLFVRFLQRAVEPVWLEVILQVLIPAARTGHEPETRASVLLRKLTVWADSNPNLVLPCWVEALRNSWPGAGDVVREIGGGIEKALEASARPEFPWDAAEWLTYYLTRDPTLEGHASYITGPVVRAWVQAGGHDEILLKFLGLDALVVTERRERRGDSRLGKRLRTFRNRSESISVPAELLTTRLEHSDVVLDAVMNYVMREAEREEFAGWLGLLDETSWRRRHNGGVMGHDALNVLLDVLEVALATRSIRRDAWWLEHEPLLATHTSPGIRYLALQAYGKHPECHVEAISRLLTDPTTYTYDELASEVRELAYSVYPLLGAATREAHQALVLTLGELKPTDREEWKQRYRRQSAYDHLCWIPAPYRMAEAQQLVDAWIQDFGARRPGPKLYMNGGFVASPVSAEQIRGLSSAAMLKVTEIWHPSREQPFAGDLVGGWDQVVSAVSEAATNVPMRALRWLHSLLRADAPAPYLNACLRGMAIHIRVRTERLSPAGAWLPDEPMPDLVGLARELLGHAEQYGGKWIDEDAEAEALEACANVLEEDQDVARLVTLLVELGGRAPDRTESNWSDASMEAVNTTRGKLACSAIHLAARLAEEDKPLPGLLTSLLRQLASDERLGVRWALLRQLPPLTQSEPELGWALLAEATRGAGSELWKAAELSLYYNYHHHFDRVGPVLQSVRANALNQAGEVYGRIGMLALLSGHLDEAVMFGALAENPDAVGLGMSDVLVANLGDASVGRTCERLLIRLLQSPEIPASVVDHVVWHLGQKDKRPHFTRSIVEALLASGPDEDEYSMRAHSIIEWMGDQAKYGSLKLLDVIEQFAAGFEAGRIRGFHGGRDLVEVLAGMLREADKTDEADVINRVIALQDRLLRLGVTEVDRMLDAASRP